MAVFGVNPVNRSIFGEKGLSKISIPVLLASGSYDPAANPIFEQAISFTWLKTSG
jgi:predicted dienelactone hydrolase